MSDPNLQIESFAAWMLAAQIGLSGASGQMPPQQPTEITLTVDNVMNAARGSRIERMVVADRDGKVISVFVGDRARVQADAKTTALMKQSGAKLSVYHSHPNNTTFSPQDLQFMVDMPGVARHVVVTKDGRWFELTMVKPEAVKEYRTMHQLHLSRPNAQTLEKFTHQSLKTLQKKGLVRYSQLR